MSATAERGVVFVVRFHCGHQLYGETWCPPGIAWCEDCGGYVGVTLTMQELVE